MKSHPGKSLCKTSYRPTKPLPRYGHFTIMQDDGRPTSWIFKKSKSYLQLRFWESISVTVPNFIPIGQTVAAILAICRFFLRTWTSLYAVARPSVVCLSVVCNVRAPYSAGWNFRQCFYANVAIWYLGHPLTSTENFTKIVPGEPLRRGS